MKHDLVADTLSIINNAERVGKRECLVPASKLIKNILSVAQKSDYIGEFEFVDDGKSGYFRVQLLGKINKTAVIKPRYAVKKGEYEKWERRFLPAKGFGILIISTPRGVVSQIDAEKLGVGGRLLAYIY
jgi:small subunit ribosomal protein S8